MKIVVSDLTDFLSFEQINKNVDAINDFVKRGNIFILATNKAMNYLAEDLSMINLDCEYYICNNGAVIFDRYFNVVYRKDLKQELVRPIYNMLLDDDNILEAYVDTSHGYVKDTTKCANGLIARPYDTNKAKILLDKISRKYPEVHGHVDDACMSIINVAVSKASAVDYLIHSYNYNKDDIVVTGVDVNDFELLQNYSGYTFKNSIEDLKNISIKTINDIKELIEEIAINNESTEEEFEFILEDYL